VISIVAKKFPMLQSEISIVAKIKIDPFSESVEYILKWTFYEKSKSGLFINPKIPDFHFYTHYKIIYDHVSYKIGRPICDFRNGRVGVIRKVPKLQF
jgi:hypothetical protein